MDSWVYRDFDLWVRGTPECARVEARDGSGVVVGPDPGRPLGVSGADGFWASLGRARRTRRLDAPDVAEAKGLGGSLFDAVFRGEVLKRWRAGLPDAGDARRGLRLRLHLEGAPELADLPWEYLYDRACNRFLALSVRTPVVRYLELDEASRRLAVTPPLTILVVVSSPRDYPKLDAEGEWLRIERALAHLVRRGLVALERLSLGSLEALQRRLRGADLHVVHFVGHGGFDRLAEEGVVIFEDEKGLGRPVPSETLGILLRDHPALRLAVLNACEGGRGAASDPFSGVAQTLVQQGLHAVIAMQAEIEDAAASLLAKELYGALADGYPVDACLGEARKALAAEGRIEWGVPVLYLRSPDGQLFDVARPVAETAARPRRDLPEDDAATRDATPAGREQPVEVFVACSEADRHYLEPGSLGGALASLEDEGLELWSDRQLAAGDLWRREIRQRLARCDVVLVLLSQPFLDSFYCRDPDLRDALARCPRLVIVVLSPCEWRFHGWLHDRRLWPEDPETLEEHCASPGRRQRLMLEVRGELRRLAAHARAGRSEPSRAGADG